MHIQQERVREFVALYKAHFDEPITDDEAAAMIAQCLQLLRMLADDFPEIAEYQEADVQQT